MSFRITMGMKMNSYRYNLMQSTNTLAGSQDKVQTHRKFTSYAEAPADATNAWRVRRNYMDNDSYYRENDDTTTRYQTAWLSMGTIKTHLEQYTGKTAVIRAANDPTGEAKKDLGNVLSNTADTVIQAMNGAKYGEEFVFAGTDGTSAPFTWDGDRLLYRGINLTPPSMLGGTKKWPEDWGSLGDDGIPVSLPKSGDTAPNDWNYDANGVLTGTYTAQKTAAKQEVTISGTGANGETLTLELPVTDDTNTTYRRAVDQNGNQVQIEGNGTTSQFVDKDGNPVQLPGTLIVGGVKYTVTSTPAGDNAQVPVVDQNGDPIMETKKGEVPQEQKDWYTYFKNVETLNKLAEETQYADLGMGMNEDKDGIVTGTYFNNAIPGIAMLGYGVDEDGDPKNLALIMKEFDHVLSTVDSNGTVSDAEGGNDRVLQLLDKFDAACDFTLDGYTHVDTQAKFLSANGETLEDQGYNLNDQIANLEQVDMADAITRFMWDYTCYNAALKIGTQLLGQSLLDYMR